MEDDTFIAAPVFAGYLPSLMSAITRAVLLAEQVGKSCYIYPAGDSDEVVVAEGWELTPSKCPYIEVHRNGLFTIHQGKSE